MPGMLIAVMLMAAPGPVEEAVRAKEYLALCEDARNKLVMECEQLIKAKEAAGNLSSDETKSLKKARVELEQLKTQPAPFVPLRIPPEEDDIGVFVSRKVDGRWGRFVDVLEVIDAHSAVIRVWYTPGVPKNKVEADKQAAGNQSKAAKDPVPLDFWAQGIDTTGMNDHSQAELPQVFHSQGNKGLPTDCGTRSLPVLTPIDVERFRGTGK